MIPRQTAQHTRNRKGDRPERIDEQLNKLKPLILIVDPLTIDAQKVKELKSTSPSRMFIIAVHNTAPPVGTVRVYDKTISIYDSIDTITATLSQILEEESDEGQKGSQPT